MAMLVRAISMDEKTMEKLHKMAGPRGASKWVRQQINMVYEKRLARTELKHDHLMPCENGCGDYIDIRDGERVCKECKKKEKVAKEKEKMAKKVARAKEYLQDPNLIAQRRKAYEDFIKKHGGEEDGIKQRSESGDRGDDEEEGRKTGTGKTEEGERGIEVKPEL